MDIALPEGFERIDSASIRWLEEAGSESFFTGIDPTPAFRAACRILHAIHEAPIPAPDTTHHDVWRIGRDEGTIEPLVVGETDIEALVPGAVISGIYRGWCEAPSDWHRLSWHELARRVELELDATWLGAHDLGPWPPGRSWPASLDPPPQGSLDPVSGRALLEVLGQRTEEAFFAYSLLTFLDLFADDPVVVRGPLGRARELFELERFGGSPQNWWPPDRSWAVWTDYDLETTVVAGSADLVRAVVAHPDIEALETLVAL